MRATVASFLLLVTLSCAHRPPVLTRNEHHCSEELIQLLIVGEPDDKVCAVRALADEGCTDAVPVMLRDFRAVYDTLYCSPEAISDIRVEGRPRPPCTVISKGERVPYVDYHSPVFVALERLTDIPYFEPEFGWFAALDAWVATHDGSQR